MLELDVTGYLNRLGIVDPGPPSADGLAALQRAHVERVPYENLHIHLGTPTTINPYDSAARILAGRGGYCYHLNGAFSLLLSALGYSVRWHRAGVQSRNEPKPVGANGNHLALSVHGLPTRGNPDGMWLVDVGLGDGPYEPLPLRTGEIIDGPFRYRLEPSGVEFLGWRFNHDPAASITGFDMRADTAVQGDFERPHEWKSTAPESPYARTVVVQRRDSTGADLLRGQVLSRSPAGGQRELTSQAEWYEALADVFGLALSDVGAYEREALWRRVCAAHEAWQAA
ncbi:arylamine N-acetyltransferase family protein [Rugosimonospora africana]|uniref:Arylamine N-acetyltransferase n=1 Tax=Rugosimonospora africana TaxID=556532 RepID=A0A8J3QME1_9ACTN|nr:arylamine N-acetyltransferase [Rugosimonospora africana]GIH13710.1 arylamine N-acetyltransferase [Rugosimonospora africana]